MPLPHPKKMLSPIAAPNINVKTSTLYALFESSLSDSGEENSVVEANINKKRKKSKKSKTKKSNQNVEMNALSAPTG